MILPSTVCSCEFCQSQAVYNPESYFVDPSQLKENRPAGISGVLNTRADELVVAHCIESCIPYLDELLIQCHCPMNEQIDKTLAIVESKAEKYPEKIRLEIYRAPILNLGLGIEGKGARLHTHIHTRANLHNQAMARARFSHYLRIDGDQVYFPGQLQKLSNWVKAGTPLFDLSDALIEEKPNRLQTIGISGINIFPAENKWFVRAGNHAQDAFSGFGDHLLHQIDEQLIYATLTEENGDHRANDAQAFRHRRDTSKTGLTTSWFGFTFFHCKYVANYKRYNGYNQRKRYIEHYYENVFKKNRAEFVPLDEYLQTEFNELQIPEKSWNRNIVEKAWMVRKDTVQIEALDSLDHLLEANNP